jgi:hypothetical protein
LQGGQYTGKHRGWKPSGWQHADGGLQQDEKHAASHPSSIRHPQSVSDDGVGLDFDEPVGVDEA